MSKTRILIHTAQTQKGHPLDGPFVLVEAAGIASLSASRLRPSMASRDTCTSCTSSLAFAT